MPGHSEDDPVEAAVRKAILATGLRVLRLPDVPSVGARGAEVVDAIARADCIVADVTTESPNVFFALGLAQALDKPLFILAQGNGPLLLPEGIGSENLLFYQPDPEGLRQLSTSLRRALRDFRKFPYRPRFLLGSRARNLFVVDWERLSREDIENLCLELLTQMGFRRVAWEKETPDIDVIAELPKKDPDGFEYRELWFVSLGRNAPPEMLLEMLSHDPDFFLRRMLRSHERSIIERYQSGEVPITFLVVTLQRGPAQPELFPSEDRPRRRPSSSGNIRVRVWDRNYLTGLVYQYPQVGFKYFSDEGRAQSKYRKTPEELNRENLNLNSRLAATNNQLTATIAALEDEKNKRVRAERDAVWKDISFTAAHKMGNPIFAIETNLDPLNRRIDEGRATEAVDVVGRIRKSVEKAKAIVAQFKSLTSAQEVRPVPTRLLPLLEEACSVATAQNVACSIDCPSELHVLGDPERLGECFDELVNNALHWFDKSERRIEVKVSQPGSGALPEQLDSSVKYATIHFRDNGAGVPRENKSKIFDAFFSTYHHGTGLGLALVRRIIEGHGGAVSECGLAGEGADFEMFLPLADQKPPALGAKDAEAEGRNGGVEG
jgi:signal transduction histidine kinase